jgi:hypothetical protein
LFESPPRGLPAGACGVTLRLAKTARSGL